MNNPEGMQLSGNEIKVNSMLTENLKKSASEFIDNLQYIIFRESRNGVLNLDDTGIKINVAATTFMVIVLALSEFGYTGEEIIETIMQLENELAGPEPEESNEHIPEYPQEINYE